MDCQAELVEAAFITNVFFNRYRQAQADNSLLLLF